MTDDLDLTTIGSPGTYEPAIDLAPATAVLSPQAAPRRGRQRWAIAAGVVAAVVAISALTLGLFTGRTANATVLGYVPADSIMYGEVRLDLPGDQRANLGTFLSKFPGFADQSTLDTKIDEVFDRLIGGATAGTQTFSADIKPWFGGELAFSVGALPDPGALSAPDASAMDDARFLILLSIKDEAATKAWFDSVIATGSVTTSTESYGETTLTLFSGGAGQQGAYALLGGKVAVVGDLTSVKAAVDTKGASGFAATPQLNAALEANADDHVGFAYVALRPLLEWSSQLAGSEAAGAVLGLVPDWAAFTLRVEGDALVMETITPASEAGPDQAANRTSAVADHVPGSAIALTISHDYGRGLLRTLDTYRSDPKLAPTMEMVDQAIGILGGTDAALGWIGDLGITVTRSDVGVEGGLVILPTVRTDAQRLFTSLRNLLSLGGASLGLSVRDEAYAGVTITIVDLGEVADLVGQSGLSPEMIGAELPAGRVELAYAITDQLAVIGSGPGFVKQVLDTTAATSIAANERYKVLIGRVGEGNGSGFADISAIRDLIESALVNADPSGLAEYEQEVKPFLTPFDALVGSTSIEGDFNRSTLIVTVK